MLISKINSSTNNFQTFGTKRLFQIRLKSVSQEPQDTYISLLTPSDKTDVEDAKDILTGDLGKTFFSQFNLTLGNECEKYAEFAQKNNKFIIIEKDDNTPLKDRLISYCYATKGTNGIHIHALNSIDKNIGAGSCILYLLSKIAQEKNLEHITAVSLREATDFYKQYQFRREKNNCDNFLELVSQYYTDFQKQLEEKYKIRKLADLE